MNRMDESFNLFESVTGLPSLSEAKIILFLNKNDLFREKIKTVDLGKFLPEYTGGCDYDAALAWITRQYSERCEKTGLYVHVTEATDTKSVQFVLIASTHILLDKSLLEFGLYT